ncbi:hypothetical protein P9858_20685 [Niallia circulans]|uniref:hypothetical protein n=1 Tax=Niallia circulans TaxID=1397 RepID=UPI000A8B09A5|nr:hypothetical protein [Niallia circulans]
MNVFTPSLIYNKLTGILGITVEKFSKQNLVTEKVIYWWRVFNYPQAKIDKVKSNCSWNGIWFCSFQGCWTCGRN